MKNSILETERDDNGQGGVRPQDKSIGKTLRGGSGNMVPVTKPTCVWLPLMWQGDTNKPEGRQGAFLEQFGEQSLKYNELIN